ncbi:MAG: DNA polymerase III subunit gamma/tau [Gemmatimonadetes bacterium]|nr:DNA polymerase III subunit gamma/tau [Gemmatimonadota bacterium]
MRLALARKYRPRSFGGVAVQSHVANTLKGAIARDRVAHGYLLCGPRGTGKTTLDRVLAMALNCEHKPGDGEPCGKCDSCQRIWAGSTSMDVVEIDAASNRGVDDARELRERALYAPSGDDRWKVYIVDEAHMLTREAWNALLKILEEPPPRVVFTFCTTEPQKIAQAALPVLSRLQRFDLRRIGPAEIADRLAVVLKEEEVGFEPDALALIARAADGGLRDALSLTDQVLALGSEGGVTVSRVRDALGLVPEDEYLAILDLVAEGRAGDVFAAVARLADLGVDFALFLAGFADLLRGQLALALGGQSAGISERTRAALTERAGKLGQADLLRMLTLVLEVEPTLRKASQPQLVLETLLVRCALLDRTVSLEELLRRLPEGAPAPLAGGSGASASGAAGGARATVARTPLRAEAATPASPMGTVAPSAASSAVAATVTSPAAASTRAAVAEPASRPTVARNAPAPHLAQAVAPPPAVAARPTSARSVPAMEEPPHPADAGAASGPPLDVEVRLGPPPVADLPDATHLAEHWGDVVEAVRANGRAVLATLVAGALPAAIAASGTLTLEVADAATVEGVERGTADLLAAIQPRWPAVTKVVVRAAGAPAAQRTRITHDTVKAEQIAALRKRDPVLGAAIDALDLEPLD